MEERALETCDDFVVLVGLKCRKSKSWVRHLQVTQICSSIGQASSPLLQTVTPLSANSFLDPHLALYQTSSMSNYNGKVTERCAEDLVSRQCTCCSGATLGLV